MTSAAVFSFRRLGLIAGATVLALGLGVAAPVPAKADGWRHGHDKHYKHYYKHGRYYAPPRVVYYPPPRVVYHAPPPVAYYPPPPVVYAPRPVYPSFSFGITFPLH